MDLDPIKRDARGLAHTQFCRETPDGGLTIADGHAHQELRPEELAPGLAFAETWIHLTSKQWFTETVAADFVNVVTARWLAKARGWI